VKPHVLRRAAGAPIMSGVFQGLSMIHRLTIRAARLTALAALGLFASACAYLADAPSTCTDQGMSSPSWPYCAPAEPGGHSPADDPINPAGGPG